MSITIDKEFQSLIPPLTADEYAQLEENCVRDGIRDPLVIWTQSDGNSILIDGHNRWDISVKHGGIPFRTVEEKFADREEAKAWIIENQFGRRNLSMYDRSVLALKLKPIIAKMAKKNQIASGGAVPQKSAKPIDTREHLANLAGVSHDTIHKVETIEAKAAPEVKQQIRSGKKSINQAYNEIRDREVKRLPNARQFEEMARERHEAVETAKTVSIEEAKQDKLDRKTLEDAAKSKVAKATGAIGLLYILANEGELNVSLMSESTRQTILSAIAGAISKLKAIQSIIEGK